MFVPWRMVAELEGTVEVVYLLLGPGNQASATRHKEARVPQIGRVQHTLLPFKGHQAGSTATCGRGDTYLCVNWSGNMEE